MIFDYRMTDGYFLPYIYYNQLLTPINIKQTVQLTFIDIIILPIPRLSLVLLPVNNSACPTIIKKPIPAKVPET